MKAKVEIPKQMRVRLFKLSPEDLGKAMEPTDMYPLREREVSDVLAAVLSAADASVRESDPAEFQAGAAWCRRLVREAAKAELDKGPQR